MILTSHSIADIGKTIDYCLQPKKISNVLCSDGLDLSGLSLDNKELHDTNNVKNDFLLYQNKRLKKPYLSLIISPEMDLTNEKLKEIVHDTLKEMNLENHQMIAITHQELRGEEGAKKPVKHVHILINRVGFNNATYNDSYIGLKGIKVISRVSQKHGLKDVYNTREYKNKVAQKEGSKYHSEKKCEIERLQKIAKGIIYRKSTFTIDDIFQELQTEHQIDINITKFKNGRFGVVFKSNGHSIKASEVSRLLSVIPMEESYTANKKLELILEKNFYYANSIQPKSMEEIQKEYLIHNDLEQLQMNLAAISEAFRVNIKKTSKNEEDKPKKKRKAKKQIGFKVKI